MGTYLNPGNSGFAEVLNGDYMPQAIMYHDSGIRKIRHLPDRHKTFFCHKMNRKTADLQ